MSIDIGFPAQIEAYEVEQGMNASFNLCIEVAKRYNAHDKLVKSLTLCAQYMGELNGVQAGTINTDILNSINDILNQTK